MGYFNRDNKGRSRGGRSFGDNRSFGGNRPRPQMHDAICDNCGKPCQLPFKPTGEKPVYCRDCFAKMGGGERSERNFDRNDAPRPEFKKFDAPREAAVSKADFDALNAKVDKILSILTAAAALDEVEEPAAEDSTDVEEVTPVVEKKKRTSKKAEVTAE